MMIRNILLIAAIALVLDGCQDPICGCTPLEGIPAVVTGTVLDAASNPVINAGVEMQVRMDRTCAEISTTSTFRTTTSTQGRFRLAVMWDAAGDKCFAVRAERPAVSGVEATPVQLVHIDLSDSVLPDSADVVLRFP